VLCLGSAGVELPTGIVLPLGFLAWLVIGIYLVYYLVAYPILHAAQRHRGSNQTRWLIWLCLELCGLGFGFVRLFYFFMHILPDIRRQCPYDSNRNA
jgi:hypothetical protein